MGAEGRSAVSRSVRLANADQSDISRPIVPLRHRADFALAAIASPSLWRPAYCGSISSSVTGVTVREIRSEHSRGRYASPAHLFAARRSSAPRLQGILTVLTALTLLTLVMLDLVFTPLTATTSITVVTLITPFMPYLVLTVLTLLTGDHADHAVPDLPGAHSTHTAHGGHAEL